MSPRKAGAARRLCLEQLETRLALATFYVAPGGNNSADGASDRPWQTLQKAADTVNPGDTVIVRAGNYVGFDLRRDGTASQRIVFDADPAVFITQRNTRTPDGINLEGADYVTIDGFTVNNMPRTGIRSVLNHHVVIRNNRMDSNYKWGILTGFSDDLLIEANETSRSQVEHGIYVSNSGDRPIIRNNVSWGNRANGIHMNGDVSLGGDGVISGALVEGNRIFDNGAGGGSGINCDGVQNSIIRNNLIYNTHASGISLYRIDGGGGSSGNTVVNNTVIVAADGRWALNIQDGSVNNTVRNNILYNYHSYRGSIDVSADSLPGFTSDYNVVTNRFTTNGGDSIQTLSQWQAAGRDVHSLLATPSQLFVNAASDFHLAEGSPAVDAGTSNFAPATDLDGRARPSGAAWDIGAYERPSAPSNTAPTNITLSSRSVPETAALGRIIGRFSAADTPGDTHTYSLLNSAGGRFAISGNRLVVAAPLDYETSAIHTIVVRATDAGGLSFDKSFNILVRNVNEVVGLDVQTGALERSYIRYVDLIFESSEGLAQLVSQDSRLGLSRYSLSGTSGVLVSIAGQATAIGNRVRLDFGPGGIGGDPNSPAGDGYYRVSVNTDGIGGRETHKHFYRLLGDANRDRTVNATDVNAVMAALGLTGVRDTDLNGDGVVNSLDVAIANAALGRTLAATLPLDD